MSLDHFGRELTFDEMADRPVVGGTLADVEHAFHCSPSSESVSLLMANRWSLLAMNSVLLATTGVL